MYVCVCACMHACMYVCLRACIDAYVHGDSCGKAKLESISQVLEFPKTPNAANPLKPLKPGKHAVSTKSPPKRENPELPTPGCLSSNRIVGAGAPLATWSPRGLSKPVISRVIIGVTPFRVLITLLITYLLSPLVRVSGY